MDAVVIALDRWGRVLLLQPREADLPRDGSPGWWGLPRGGLKAFEAPDEAALRAFEEETGHLLDTLRLFRVYRRADDLPAAIADVMHVYYDDPDVDVANITSGERRGFGYFGVDELPFDAIAPSHRVVLEDFVASTAYRAMFH